jgi:hypothetical protein
MQDVIGTAAILAEYQAAANMLRQALKIELDAERPSHFLTDDETLNHPTPWARASYAQRIKRIAHWFGNECTVAVAEGEKLVTIPRFSTIGD